MRRYFFHLHECGTVTQDLEGQEFESIEAARVAALQTARGIMAGEIEAGRLCLLCHIHIHDAEGTLLLKVPFKEAVIVTGL